MSDPIELVADLERPNVRPFLWMLRHGEGTQGEDGYRTMFGGGLFDSFADHPRKAVTRNGLTSTAAGAGQILARTWDGLVKQYGFADFSPANQDLAMVALIKGRKALDDVIAGRFEDAVRKCNKEWASLPGSPYGQPVVTMARARQEYEQAGGMFADQEVPLVHLGPEPPAIHAMRQVTPISDPIPQEPTMLPAFIAAALPSLLSAVPELIKMFGSGSEMSERNAKAAEVAVAVAKEAIGARNEQELVETLQNDPEAAATVRKAVQDNWWKLEEVGGGIQAARASNVEASIPGHEFWKQPAFYITLMLLPLVYFVTYKVLTGTFSPEVQSMVVAAIISGVLGAVTGFWLGASFKPTRSDPKTAA